jgi:hypothetical protein
MKFSRADSRIKMWKFSDVSETNSVPIFRVLLVLVINLTTSNTLKMGTKLVSKTSETFTFWCGCLPENISLNSAVAKASRLITLVFHTERIFTWRTVFVWNALESFHTGCMQTCRCRVSPLATLCRPNTRGARTPQKSSSHLKNSRARRVTWSTFHTEDPQIFRHHIEKKNSVAMAT